MSFTKKTDDDIISQVAFLHFLRNEIPEKPINSNINIMVLLQSPRFQGILVIGLLQALVLFNIITSEQGQGLIEIVQGIIGAAVAVGSLDRVGKQA